MFEYSLWKDGRLVGESHSLRKSESPGIPEMGIPRLSFFYLSNVQMPPPILWEHLSGRALRAFFDNCGLMMPKDETVDWLRYVHGRSEVMKGKASISAVLLAQATDPVPEDAWMAALPEIYRRFCLRP